MVDFINYTSIKKSIAMLYKSSHTGMEAKFLSCSKITMLMLPIIMHSIDSPQILHKETCDGCEFGSTSMEPFISLTIISNICRQKSFSKSEEKKHPYKAAMYMILTWW